MADITLYINGTQKTANETTLRVLAAIACTANPGADTVKKAVELAGGAAYVQSFAKNGKKDDEFAVIQKGKRAGAEVTITGKGTRQVLTNRMQLALDAVNWQTTITTESEGKTVKENTPVAAMELV